MYQARDIDRNERFRFRDIDTLMRRYDADHYAVAHRMGERTIVNLLKGRPGYSSVQGSVNIPSIALQDRGAIVRVSDPGYQSHHVYVWLGWDGNWYADITKARTDLVLSDILKVPAEIRQYSMFQPHGPYRP